MQVPLKLAIGQLARALLHSMLQWVGLLQQQQTYRCMYLAAHLAYKGGHLVRRPCWLLHTMNLRL